MWLADEKYDWLATWSRLVKAKWLTDDLSQYDWRRRRYDDFSHHRRRLQHSPGPLAEFEGMWRGKRKERRGKKTKRGKWREEVGVKEREWNKKGRGNGRGSEGRDGTQLFGRNWHQCQPVIYIRVYPTCFPEVNECMQIATHAHAIEIFYLYVPLRLCVKTVCVVRNL